MRSRSTLADTSVLLRFLDKADTSVHPRIIDTFARLTAEGHTLFITPQNIIEMWNVATRPSTGNGFGLIPEQADRLAARAAQEFTLLEETPDLFPMWQLLASQAKVSGKQVHDTRLVAFMRVHGVQNVLTLNATDFRRFEALTGIVVIEPDL